MSEASLAAAVGAHAAELDGRGRFRPAPRGHGPDGEVPEQAEEDAAADEGERSEQDGHAQPAEFLRLGGRRAAHRLPEPDDKEPDEFHCYLDLM